MTSQHEAQQVPLSRDHGPWGMLSSMLPTADWTYAAHAGVLKAAVTNTAADHDTMAVHRGGEDCRSTSGGVHERMARALYGRKRRHLLVTGDGGVGKTAALRELARRAALGEIDFLSDHRFLWIDAANIGIEDSRACLETIAALAADPPEFTELVSEDDLLEQPLGRMIQSAFERALGDANRPERLVLCLDGLDMLLRRPQGGTNVPLLRAIADQDRIQIAGILSRWAYNDLVAGDAGIRDRFTRIEIEEPDAETTLAILQQSARDLACDYGLDFDDEVVERTFGLTSNYLLGEAHPAKGIRVLQQACDDVDFTRTQHGTAGVRVLADDVVRVVAEQTGIPTTTLSGEGGTAGLESALAEAVVGQPRAVQAAATELRLIQAGLAEPGKPAGVLLFAGMTGVGKTELAKRIAELYSTSKRLTTYSMGNFTEPHSVSGIIGVPPGYVGHEEGGRLINELNADPYSVFLLDEAEKCHANVWKPFLNLFDEGWIVDQRGQKAYADRAIFILTTNAGDKTIAQMSRSDKPEAEIVDRVKATLSRVRPERSSQPVFTAQFLARIKRTVVFGPLDEEAMKGITRIIVKRVQELWREKRDKELEIPEEVIADVAHRAHLLNEKSNGEEGGRIVRKLISERIEHTVQLAATNRADEYRACRIIHFALIAASGADDAADACENLIEVRFDEGS